MKGIKPQVKCFFWQNQRWKSYARH